MIIIEILFAIQDEIKRQKDILPKGYPIGNSRDYLLYILNHLISFTDKIKEDYLQNVQDCELLDFGNELTKYIAENFTVCNDETILNIYGDALKSFDVEGIASYFYELGKNSK